MVDSWSFTYSTLMSAGGHALGAFAFLASLAVLLVVARQGREEERMPFVVGWVLRAGFCIFNTYFFTAMVDDFEGSAAELSSFGLRDIFTDFGVNSNSYTWFCTLIYYAIGRNPVVLQVVNILFWIGSMANLQRMVGDLGCRRSGTWALWAFALLPTSVTFSVSILRESICIFMISSGARYWLSAFSRHNPIHYLLSGMFFILSAVSHYGCVVLLIGIATMPLLHRWTASQKKSRGIVFQFSALLMGGMLLAVLFYGGLFEVVAPSLSGENLTFDDVSGISSTGGELAGRTNYMGGLSASSPVDFLWQAPVRVIFFCFSPLPWMMSKMLDGFAFMDSVLYMIVLYVIFRSPRALLGDPRLLGATYLALLGIVVFSLGTVNFGTALRHRGKFLPLLLASAACAWEVQRQRKNSRRSVPAPGFVPRPLPARNPQALHPSRREV